MAGERDNRTPGTKTIGSRKVRMYQNEGQRRAVPRGCWKAGKGCKHRGLRLQGGWARKRMTLAWSASRARRVLIRGNSGTRLDCSPRNTKRSQCRSRSGNQRDFPTAGPKRAAFHQRRYFAFCSCRSATTPTTQGPARRRAAIAGFHAIFAPARTTDELVATMQER